MVGIPLVGMSEKLVCLDVEFLKLELNFYFVSKFQGLTFEKKLNKILFI
jgi:hypothetical protein